MNKFFILFAFLFSCSASLFAANGDTTQVNVFNKFHMSRYGNFDQKAKMPANKTFQRVWLKYTLGCLSNGQCEWDYTIKLFLREHTGKNDSTLQQAPYLKVNNTAKDSVVYSLDTTWRNVYNALTKQTDSVASTSFAITLFGDSLNPLNVTQTIVGFPVNYWRVNFDTTGARKDSVFVGGGDVIRQKFTPYYRVFEVVNNLEMGRFISPYAKSFPKSFQYDYIYDVTDYAYLLTDSAEFRIEYQGYSYGFTANWDMIFVEGTPAREVVKIENIYNGGFNYGQATSIEAALSQKSYTVPADAVATKARIIITGHGADNSEGCAEFCAKKMYLKHNGTQVADQLVWKDDCGSNPIPAQPGTWVYNRSNWCPGEKIRNYDYMLNVTPGSTNTVDLDMEQFTANGAASYNISLQLIHYKAQKFENDAAVEDIIAPSKNYLYNRINPICDNAKFVLKNWGSKKLTSAEISYQIGNNEVQKLNWTGELPFEKETIVTIPYLQWPSNLTDRTFKVWVSKVNGLTTDDNMHNNVMHSKFDLPVTLPSSFVVQTLTNNVPSQNSYTITDGYGNLVASKTYTAANTLHRDTFNLGFGCYTFKFIDTEGNGLAWWAAQSDGTGSLRIQNVGSPIQIFKTFTTDFGSFQQLNFRVQHAVSVEEELLNSDAVKLYPNPANNLVTIEGMDVLKAEITDASGKVISNYHHPVSGLDISNIPAGIYFIRLTNSNRQSVVKKLSIIK